MISDEAEKGKRAGRVAGGTKGAAESQKMPIRRPFVPQGMSAFPGRQSQESRRDAGVTDGQDGLYASETSGTIFGVMTRDQELKNCNVFAIRKS